jgi:hypothetical protein
MLVSWVLAVAIAAASAVPMNMNGEYLIGNPNTRVQAQYSTDYGTKNAEYFDVYTPPIRTVYGEVFWSVSLRILLEFSFQSNLAMVWLMILAASLHE